MYIFIVSSHTHILNGLNFILAMVNAVSTDVVKYCGVVGIDSV